MRRNDKLSWRTFGWGWLAGVATVGLAGGSFAALVLWGGIYNVGADSPHLNIVGWAVHRTMISSVAHRTSADAEQPIEPADIERGARVYVRHCEMCHGGPGVARARWVSATLPTPPFLIDAPRHWSRAQLRNIVIHGVKMTGMPAWGELLSKRDIEAVTSFLMAMPKLDRDSYALLRENSPQTIAQRLNARTTSRAQADSDPAAPR